MRIVGGLHRGLTLADVGRGDPAAHLRPTSDRVREAIFNVLLGGRFGNPVSGAHVLDLFAGTGALGIEALSRGATFATFVDSGRVAQGLIRENLRRARREGDARLIAAETGRIPAREGTLAGLVFLDPPYGRLMGQAALAAAKSADWISPGAVVVWEDSGPQLPPAGFTLVDQRRYGDTHVTFLTADSA